MKWTRKRLLRYILKWMFENLSLVVEIAVTAWALLRWMI